MKLLYASFEKSGMWTQLPSNSAASIIQRVSAWVRCVCGYLLPWMGGIFVKLASRSKVAWEVRLQNKIEKLTGAENMNTWPTNTRRHNTLHPRRLMSSPDSFLNCLLEPQSKSIHVLQPTNRGWPKHFRFYYSGVLILSTLLCTGRKKLLEITRTSPDVRQKKGKTAATSIIIGISYE